MSDVAEWREQAAALAQRLTLDEKASLTAGVDMWSTRAIERLGIPSVRLTDGPHGARGRFWGPAAIRALAMPTGSALGATWDVELLRSVGVELGRETRARGARVLLGPTVNPQRAPLAGRTFECFSEDPLLSGRLGAAYVDGVQSEGVAATVEHLAGNEAEWQRNSVDSIIDERTLREVYLLPFELCVQAGALAVMTSYNRLNGAHCPNAAWLLRDILRGEWGFDGVVISDWWGLLDTAAAAEAGLDLEMPGPARAYGAELADAVRSGAVPEQHLDDIANRLLGMFIRLGAMNDRDEGELIRDEHASRAVARHVSASAMVLIKNERQLLPLDVDRLKRIAVIGPNGAIASIMGGGSSQVRAQHRSPLADALRRSWGERVEIVFEPGLLAESEEATPLEPWELTAPGGAPGLEVAYFGDATMSGRPLAVHHGDDFRLQFLGSPADGVPYPHFSVRASATFTASVAGKHEFVLRSNAPARLRADGATVEDLSGLVDADWFGDIHERPWSVDLDEGQRLDLVVEFVNPEFDTYSRTTLACRRPSPADAHERAVRAAKEADVVIVVVGTTDNVESEGFDRATLHLPEGQDALIGEILDANRDTVVVVNTGGPVAMPWLDDAPAVLQAWFGGQEMGAALADVLDGSAEPAGRMPFTVPCRIEDTPTFGSFPGEFGTARYAEALLIGHRWYDTRQIPVAVPFGHGGSYTSFAWSNAMLCHDSAGPEQGTTVHVTVQNTGNRTGSDVIQVYVRPPTDLPFLRPLRELKGFAKVCLDPGEHRDVEIELPPRSFAHWVPHDSSARYHDLVRSTPFASTVPRGVDEPGWTVAPGEYTIEIARSIADVFAALPFEMRSSSRA